MAKKNPSVMRISPEMRELIGEVKKKYKDELGVTLSNSQASEAVAKDYKKNGFLKKDTDDMSIFR